MYVNFHKRPGKIPLKGWMTSEKLISEARKDIRLSVSDPSLKQSKQIVCRRNFCPHRNCPVNQARNGSGHENGPDFESQRRMAQLLVPQGPEDPGDGASEDGVWD